MNQEQHPILNALLVLSTISWTAVSDFLPDIDLALSFVTRFISIVSFGCFLILNYDSLVSRVKKIFSNGK